MGLRYVNSRGWSVGITDYAVKAQGEGVSAFISGGQ